MWVRFLWQRLLSLFAVVLGLLVATFLIVHLIPGDPARRAAGVNATAEDVAQLRTSLGLDRPLAVQFVDYLGHAVRLDFGKSFSTQERVGKILADRLPHTVQLAALALVFVLLLSVPLGLIMGALTRDGRRPRLEVAFTAITGMGGALPEYLAGTFLAFLFGVWLHWLPVAGATKWQSIILPALAVSLRPALLLARIVRLEVLNVLQQDYIRTARSKRLPAYLIYVRHTLPNVLTAALTVGGLLFAGLLGGTVVVENVFAWPGLGTEVVRAVLTRDYPVIQAVVLMLGLIVVLINTTVDVVLGMLDPRSLVREV